MSKGGTLWKNFPKKWAKGGPFGDLFEKHEQRGDPLEIFYGPSLQIELDAPLFLGLGVVDFEDYRAAFRQNFGLLDVYRNMSRSRVHESHPSWNRGRVDNETALQFNEAAKYVHRLNLNPWLFFIVHFVKKPTKTHFRVIRQWFLRN